MSGTTEDFVNGLREEYGEPGPDNSHPMAPWGGALLEKGVEYGGAFARGALKQSTEAPGLRAILPQGITDWAKEVDPNHPDVEGAGRYVTPTNVLLRGLPDLPALAGAQKTYDAAEALAKGAGRKAVPWIQRTASNLAQNAWKSTVGGAAEANLDTPSGDEAGRRVLRGGAEGLGTGVGLSAAQGALRMLPRWMIPAAIGAAHLAHGGPYLWHDIRHAMGEALTALAARSARVPAGLVGAAGEAGAQKAGYEPGGGGETEQPEPF